MPSSQLTRRSFLAALSAIASPAWSASGEVKPKRPNIVLVMADDLGYGDLGVYGCPDIRTPNLDRLARQGVRLTDFYASAPVCTPTRCALMTGRYQQRQRNLEWAIYPSAKTVGLPPEETTIASLLRDAGYVTGMFGKWHLGSRPENGPNRHGFDEFFGLLGGNIDYFSHTDSTLAPDLYENTTPVKKMGYITDLITERSADFIQRHRSKPFFLYTAFNAPHWPMQGPDDAKKKITPGKNWNSTDRPTYITMVERMDVEIGKILSALKENGLEENTLVLFCSDNGGDRASRNAPLSGRKGQLREGGIRVPCIARWPNVIPAGTVSSQAAITMDLSATILSAARIRPPHSLDGITLLPYIGGFRQEVEQTFVWRSDWRGEKAVRWGKWKWLKEKEKEYLFNLKEDIGETVDRKDRNIDIYHCLKTIYDQWEKAMPHRQTRFGNALRNLPSK